MVTQAQNQQKAVDGIAAIEKSIIEHAERQQVQGLRLEWNEDLDFGHLMDPVPVLVMTRDGRSVEERFSLAEMADFVLQPQTATLSKIEHIAESLAHATPSEDVGDSRGA